MRDPYEVLGIPRGADASQVKSAYRALAKKYHPDNYVDSPLASVANEKMQELNEAYDTIMASFDATGHSSGSTYEYSTNAYSNPYESGQGGGYSGENRSSSYIHVRSLINQNRLDEAERILEGMPQRLRDAQWYYLKGQINYNRGWIDQAYTYFTTAHNMDPSNIEYRHIYENLRNERNGGFRTAREGSVGSSCGPCDVCSSLLCADCCCESMGGDLIPCC